MELSPISYTTILMSLSRYDGTAVAIGSPTAAGENEGPVGFARVYRFKDGKWNWVGPDLSLGDEAEISKISGVPCVFREAVKYVGALGLDTENGDDAGGVFVYNAIADLFSERFD
jgi:hypothetical protein